MTHGFVIYRAMEEDVDGLPKKGTSSTKLGIRKGKDIEVDVDDNVARPQFHPGEPNGLSCAPGIAELPAFARPVTHGGQHPKTVVWSINSDELRDELAAQQDGSTHILIGPAKTMPYNEYVEAIDATRTQWQKVE